MSQGDPYPDHFNPILVKELRQGLRSRGYTGILLLSQGVAALFNFACMIAGKNLSAGDSAGVLAVGLFLIFVVALPLTSINAIGGELARDTFPLVRLSHLDGWRVLYGKWVARSAETLLLAISLLPHFILRFFLGGTEIGGELSYFGVCILASVVFSAVAIACSVQRNWLIRIGLLTGVVAGVLFSNMAVFMLQVDAITGGAARGFLRLKPDFLDGPGSLLLATAVNLLCVAVILFWAAERLALSPVTYQPQLRLFALGGCFALPAALCADAFFHGTFNFNNPPLFTFLTAPLPMVSLLILLHGFWSEPPTLLPRPTGWKRIWLFRPGWPGGVWFFCLTYGLVCAIVALFVSVVPVNSFRDREINDITHVLLAFAIIALGAFLLWRAVQRKFPSPPWLWLVVWLVVGVLILAGTTYESARGSNADQLVFRFLSHVPFGIGVLDILDNSYRLTGIIRLLLPAWFAWAAILACLALRLASRRILADDKALASAPPQPASPTTNPEPPLSV